MIVCRQASSNISDMALDRKNTVLCVLILGSMVVHLALSACSVSDESTLDSQCLNTYFGAVASTKCRNIDCSTEYGVVIDCVNTELLGLTRGCQTDVETYFDAQSVSETNFGCTYSAMVGRCPSASTWDVITTAGTTLSDSTLADTTIADTTTDAATTTATTTIGGGGGGATTETTQLPATTGDWVPPNNGCDSSLKASMLAACVAGIVALVINSSLRPALHA